MMFSVGWKKTAESHLTSLWLSAKNKSAISAAANKIDELLRTDADTCGESRDGDRRILLVPPLGVDYSVSVPDRRVLVLSVWLMND